MARQTTASLPVSPSLAGFQMVSTVTIRTPIFIQVWTRASTKSTTTAAVMSMISIALTSTPTTDAIAAANIDDALVASLTEMPVNVTAAMI